MILTPAQVRAFQKATAVANDVLPQIEWLEQIAAAYPPVLERVQIVRAQRDMLARLAEVGLEADRVLSQG